MTRTPGADEGRYSYERDYRKQELCTYWLCVKAHRLAGEAHGLARRTLLETGGEHAAKYALLNIAGFKTGAAHRLGDGHGTELGRTDGSQGTLKTAHGGSGTVDNKH